MRRFVIGLAGVAVAASLVYLARAEQTPQQTAKSSGPPPAPVIVDKSAVRTVPVRLDAIGTVQARSTVSIKSRVGGQLVQAAITEGQRVKKGDLLFQIDSRPFQAQLRQVEANLARDQANLNKAEADLGRYQSLSEKGYSSQQKYEEVIALKNSLLATIRADEAAIEMAKLNMEYTTIRAPVDGRTGALLAHPGNMIEVSNSAAPLLVITETQPIYVAFSVPEKYLARIKQRVAAGTVKINVTLPDFEGRPVVGELFFINNAVDTTTGTIQLKATFDNKDDLLTPGQFVQVNLDLEAIEDAVVVPVQAVQNGQKGSYVFVMKPDKTVELRMITVGPSTNEVTVVREGLASGETVVVDGQLRLFPGARVAPRGVGQTTPGQGKAAQS